MLVREVEEIKIELELNNLDKNSVIAIDDLFNTIKEGHYNSGGELIVFSKDRNASIAIIRVEDYHALKEKALPYKIRPEKVTQEEPIINTSDNLKIGGFNWILKEVEHLMAERDRVGEMNPREHSISIDRAANNQQREEILIHEIIEALNVMYNINLEHYQIELLGVTLHQVLKDNEINLK